MPLAIDLFCGLGGWTEGLLAEGWDVIGFDIERHEYWGPEISAGDAVKGTKPVKGRGWTQGCAVALGMEGANRRPNTVHYRYPAQLVVQDVLTLHGSQFKSADLIVASPPCQEYSYMAMPWSRAKQIMRALRGEDDFPEGYKGSRNTDELNALFLACFRIQREASEAAGRTVPLIVENVRGAQPWVGRAAWNYGSFYLWGDVPALMPFTAQKHHKIQSPHLFLRGPHKANGKYTPKNSEAYKVAAKAAAGARFTSRDCGLEAEGRKQRGSGREWFAGEDTIGRTTSSKSPARKHASAMIAKIPEPLARHIARVFRPVSASPLSSRSAPRDGRAAAAAADGGDTG